MRVTIASESSEMEFPERSSCVSPVCFITTSGTLIRFILESTMTWLVPAWRTAPRKPSIACAPSLQTSAGGVTIGFEPTSRVFNRPRRPSVSGSALMLLPRRVRCSSLRSLANSVGRASSSFWSRVRFVSEVSAVGVWG